MPQITPIAANSNHPRLLTRLSLGRAAAQVQRRELAGLQADPSGPTCRHGPLWLALGVGEAAGLRRRGRSAATGRAGGRGAGRRGRRRCARSWTPSRPARRRVGAPGSGRPPAERPAREPRVPDRSPPAVPPLAPVPSRPARRAGHRRPGREAPPAGRRAGGRARVRRSRVPRPASRRRSGARRETGRGDPANNGVAGPRGGWMTWMDTADSARKAIAPAETTMTGTVLPAGWERNTAPARPTVVRIRSASQRQRQLRARAAAGRNPGGPRSAACAARRGAAAALRPGSR